MELDKLMLKFRRKKKLAGIAKNTLRHEIYKGGPVLLDQTTVQVSILKTGCYCHKNTLTAQENRTDQI